MPSQIWSSSSLNVSRTLLPCLFTIPDSGCGGKCSCRQCSINNVFLFNAHLDSNNSRHGILWYTFLYHLPVFLCVIDIFTHYNLKTTRLPSAGTMAPQLDLKSKTPPVTIVTHANYHTQLMSASGSTTFTKFE